LLHAFNNNKWINKIQKDEEYFSLSDDDEDDTNGNYVVIQSPKQQLQQPTVKPQNMSRDDDHDIEAPSSPQAEKKTITTMNLSPRLVTSTEELKKNSPAMKQLEEELSQKKAFCLESAMWAAQFSNLVYWDPV